MVYVFFAHGFEEIEAVTIVDILKRANIDVKSVGIGSKTITGAHGITIHCDIIDKEVNNKKISTVVLPGGQPGTNNLNKSKIVINAIEYALENDLLVAAICAAPIILGERGFLKGKSATVFPGLEEHLKEANLQKDSVVIDGNIITANGPASAMSFALEIVAYIKGEETAAEIGEALQCSTKA